VIVTKKVSVEEDEVVDVICNRCGESQRRVTPSFVHEGETHHEYVHFRDTVKVDHGWGYHSGQDQTVIRFHLCEQCVGEVVATFKVPPELSEYEGPFYECQVCGR